MVGLGLDEILSEAEVSVQSVVLSVVLVILIIYQFLGISILCDEKLCPALESLCAKLKITEAMAGATLLAFGSSAPELIIGACGAFTHQTALSIPTILVSALIAFAAIPAFVVWAVGNMVLRPSELIRDALCYLLALLFLMAFIIHPVFQYWKSLILTLGYAVYVFYIWLQSRSVESKAVASVENGEYAKLEEELERVVAEEDAGGDEENEHKPLWYVILTWPFDMLFHFTVPATWPTAAFVICVAWLALLSESSLYCCVIFCRRLQFSEAAAGMTLLAFGGQVPDTIAAVELARNGHPDCALAQAVASQVINITLGVGLPFLIRSLVYGEPVVLGTGWANLTISITLLISIALYLCVVSPCLCAKKAGDGRSIVVGKMQGITLAACFLILYPVSVIVVELGF
uniref:Sodium/calcium exchanger membrane region domain-containing protein n=1 Tax=Noctiluca scintillans TaxID=2966 RepID=A0A7S0ZQN2_NOCSC